MSVKRKLRDDAAVVAARLSTSPELHAGTVPAMAAPGYLAAHYREDR